MTISQDIISDTKLENPASNFTIILKEILELLDLEAEDDYGILKPTEYAVKTTMKWVIEAYEIMESPFPRGSACTDEKGGITLDWTSKDQKRAVILFCPFSPDQSAYIYHDTSDEYASEEIVSVSTLVQWLEWFNAE